MEKKIKDWIIDNVQQIEDGDIDSIPFARNLKAIMKTCKTSFEQIEHIVKAEILTYSKEQQNEYGFAVNNTGSTYDYKHIPEWIEAKKKLDDIQEMYKSGHATFDEETGEVFTVIKKAKKESITFKK